MESGSNARASNQHPHSRWPVAKSSTPSSPLPATCLSLQGKEAVAGRQGQLSNYDSSDCRLKRTNRRSSRLQGELARIVGRSIKRKSPLAVNSVLPTSRGDPLYRAARGMRRVGVVGLMNTSMSKVAGMDRFMVAEDHGRDLRPRRSLRERERSGWPVNGSSRGSDAGQR